MESKTLKKIFTREFYKPWAEKAKTLAKDDKVLTVLAGLGLFVTARCTANFLCYYYRHFLRRGHDLIKRYGQGSWALVTGASDGIGKAFALELAARGFNIILIGRNQKKLEGVVEEIKAINNKAQTRIVIADFYNSFKPGFFENIYKQVEDLDISILVNNAGDIQRDLFDRMLPTNLFNLMLLNCVPYTIMSRLFIEKLLKRDKRSAVISISSLLADRYKLYAPIYCATKRYNDIQTRSIAKEFGDRIDVLSTKPGFVNSQLTPRKEDWLTTVPSKFVKVVLRQLGHTNEIYGHWKHYLKERLMGVQELFPPKWLVTRQEQIAINEKLNNFYNKRKEEESKQ